MDCCNKMWEKRQNILFNLNSRSHLTWGLDIHRTSFKDDKLWQRCLDYIKASIMSVSECEESDQRSQFEGLEREMAWQYVESFSIIRLYEELCETNHAWHSFFAWPSDQAWNY